MGRISASTWRAPTIAILVVMVAVVDVVKVVVEVEVVDDLHMMLGRARSKWGGNGQAPRFQVRFDVQYVLYSTYPGLC